ncbi:MAG TPA: MFS transporter [Streptosporangiaceae bacterium]|jgi:MFS family permease
MRPDSRRERASGGLTSEDVPGQAALTGDLGPAGAAGGDPEPDLAEAHLADASLAGAGLAEPGLAEPGLAGPALAELRAGGRRGNPYLAVLRLPGALGFSAAGFVARMPMSMFGLGTVLLIAAVTGKYGVAGVVAAVGSVGYALGAPQFGRLADAYGQHRVLRPQVAVFVLGTVALMVLAEAGAPLIAVAVAGAIAGITMPSIGSMVRARWSVLLAGTDRLHTAFSLESVADEIIFVVGPALVTLLATDVYPAAGVGAAMLLCAVGTVLFAGQRRTEPPPHPRPPAASRSREGGRVRRGPAVRGLVTLVPVYLLLGGMFATIELSTVAFASEVGHKAEAGFVLGVYALGSAVGGLWYGSRHWRGPLARRFIITLACMTAGVATFWFQPGLATLYAVIFVAGLAIAPTLINGFSLVEEQAPPARRTEGMTWLSSAIAVGVAIGSPVAGHIIDAHNARWGYVLAAGFGVAALLVGLGGHGRLRPASPR